MSSFQYTEKNSCLAKTDDRINHLIQACVTIVPERRVDVERSCREIAICCAELALPVWEREYPADNRPRLALEAAKAYYLDQGEENRETSYRAGNASTDAAYEAEADVKAATLATNYAEAKSRQEAHFAALTVSHAAHTAISSAVGARAPYTYYSLLHASMARIDLQPVADLVGKVEADLNLPKVEINSQ